MQRAIQLVLPLTLGFFLTACGFVAGQIHDKAMEEQLLKPGALDPRLTDVYDTYSFKFLNRYRVTHEYIRNSDGCSYAQRPTRGEPLVHQIGEYYEVTDIYEQDGHTWQASSSPGKPFSFDRYTRPEWVMGSGKNTSVQKGFTSVCFQSWGGTGHVLTVKLFKRNIQEWREVLRTANPTGKFAEEQVGDNHWMTQTTELAPLAPGTTVGGAYQSWTTPIGDTGYTLTVQLGASTDSLAPPGTHAHMQAILRHLIESVRIEPLAQQQPQ